MAYNQNEVDYGTVDTGGYTYGKQLIRKDIAGYTQEELNEDFPNGLPPIINALEINWNGANMYQVLGEGFEEFANVVTTTQLLKLIAKVYLLATGTTINDGELNIEYVGDGN